MLAKQDIGIEGGNLRGETATIDAGRDFWIASLQGTSTSASSSSGFNASLTFGPGGVPTSGSLGVNGSSGAGDKAWTDKPSSLTAAGALDITVGKQTNVLGGLINSDAGKLDLKTGTLVTADLTDRDVYQSTGGGITVGFGGGFPVKTLSFDIQDRRSR